MVDSSGIPFSQKRKLEKRALLVAGVILVQEMKIEKLWKPSASLIIQSKRDNLKNQIDLANQLKMWNKHKLHSKLRMVANNIKKARVDLGQYVV